MNGKNDKCNQVVQNINDKRLYKFLQFDIKHFYPSYKENCYMKLYNLLKNIRVYNDRTLYNDEESWVKKEHDRFDVSMGAYDRTEVCELITIYMFYLIGKKYNF